MVPLVFCIVVEDDMDLLSGHWCDRVTERALRAIIQCGSTLADFTSVPDGTYEVRVLAAGQRARTSCSC